VKYSGRKQLSQQWQLTHQPHHREIPFNAEESDKGKKAVSRIKKLNKEISSLAES